MNISRFIIKLRVRQMFSILSYYFMYVLIFSICTLLFIWPRNKKMVQISQASSLTNQSSNLPSLYSYYTGAKISTGLDSNHTYFTLNKRKIAIYSGSLHYFRIPKAYWGDRLRKMRAAGLNTIDTYIPWNLHEPQKGVFDFGRGGSDFEEFLDLELFLKLVQEEDLFAIIRPGPYICAEWEFGGLPSWLLRYKIYLRSSDSRFLKHVSEYFEVLLKKLEPLQFTKGGPIIAFQIENEFGSLERSDTDYLIQLKNILLENNIKELMFTTDSVEYEHSGAVPELFQTINFGIHADIRVEFSRLEKMQPGKPIMIMELWIGWFDHWLEKHHKVNSDTVMETLEWILTSRPYVSLNFYMFHGGTTWGFMNGANLYNAHEKRSDNKLYQPDTTSYDYNAPISEYGNYTKKYFHIAKLLSRYNKIKTRLPNVPPLVLQVTYPPVAITEQLLMYSLLNQVDNIQYDVKNVLSMELLNINNKSGQSFGYIVYRKTNLDIPANSIVLLHGRIYDTAMILINGQLVSKPLTEPTDLNGFGYWRKKNAELLLPQEDFLNSTLDIIVENWGRVNFGKYYQFAQFKGLRDNVRLNNRILKNWSIIPLEFKTEWTQRLKDWTHKPINFTGAVPSLYKGILNVDEPYDTFLDMRQWTKGIVIINGFVLGRYCSPLGPQQTLYLPAPFLKTGPNEIVIFEHFRPHPKILFSDKPIYFTPPNVKEALTFLDEPDITE